MKLYWQSNKLLTLLILFFLLVFIRTAECQIIQPTVVNGNTYTCYFISQLDIFRTDIVFDDKGMLELTAYTGNGFYFTLTDLFMGVYWSLNQTIGLKKGDFIFIISGNTKDPFVAGICLMIYEYKEIFLAVFFGFRSISTP